MAVTVLNADTFDETIRNGKLVIVDFFATWCGPCKAMAPTLEEISETLPDDQMIAKLDIDQNQQLAMSYGVMSIPTLIAFKNGKALCKSVGLQPKEQVLEMIDYALKTC